MHLAIRSKGYIRVDCEYVYHVRVISPELIPYLLDLGTYNLATTTPYIYTNIQSIILQLVGKKDIKP